MLNEWEMIGHVSQQCFVEYFFTHFNLFIFLLFHRCVDSVNNKCTHIRHLPPPTHIHTHTLGNSHTRRLKLVLFVPSSKQTYNWWWRLAPWRRWARRKLWFIDAFLWLHARLLACLLGCLVDGESQVGLRRNRAQVLLGGCRCDLPESCANKDT